MAPCQYLSRRSKDRPVSQWELYRPGIHSLPPTAIRRSARSLDDLSCGCRCGAFDLELHGELAPSGTPDGTLLDAVFGLIEESPNAAGTDLRTGCVTVTVR
jgi:hypothetical protein